MREHVLVIIKPDALAKGIAGNVMDKFFQIKLELLAARVVKVTRQAAEMHYQHIKGTSFYQGAIDLFMGKFHKQKRVLALIFSGENAISICRKLAGATNPEEADPRSIRGAYGRVTTKRVFENVIHVSSDRREAEREIKLWFSPCHLEETIFPVKEAVGNKRKIKVWA